MPRSRRATIAGLALVIALSSSASEGAPPDLHTRLDAKRRALGRVGDQAKVLTLRISRDGRRIDQLQAELVDARRRLVGVDAQLARRRVELDRVQQARRRETVRRFWLVRRLAEARRVLADRLVAVCKADDADVINVVFRAESLADVSRVPTSSCASAHKTGGSSSGCGSRAPTRFGRSCSCARCRSGRRQHGTQRVTGRRADARAAPVADRRDDHVAVRATLGEAPRRPRHRCAGGDADQGRGCRTRRPGRSPGRVRPLYLHPAFEHAQQLLRAPGRGSTPRSAPRCRRDRSSERWATPAARLARTCTSRPGSRARRWTRCGSCEWWRDNAESLVSGRRPTRCRKGESRSRVRLPPCHRARRAGTPGRHGAWHGKRAARRGPGGGHGGHGRLRAGLRTAAARRRSGDDARRRL